MTGSPDAGRYENQNDCQHHPFRLHFCAPASFARPTDPFGDRRRFRGKFFTFLEFTFELYRQVHVIHGRSLRGNFGIERG